MEYLLGTEAANRRHGKQRARAMRLGGAMVQEWITRMQEVVAGNTGVYECR